MELGGPQRSSIPLYSPNSALLPHFQILGRVISMVTLLPLGYWDLSLCHMCSFSCQVMIQVMAGARAEAEGNISAPFQESLIKMYYMVGEVRCFQCQIPGHVCQDYPLNQQWGGEGYCRFLPKKGLLLPLAPLAAKALHSGPLKAQGTPCLHHQWGPRVGGEQVEERREVDVATPAIPPPFCPLSLPHHSPTLPPPPAPQPLHPQTTPWLSWC